MSFMLRAARLSDLDALYEMSQNTGGGFTNLPPDRPNLQTRLERAVASFTRQDDVLADDQFLFVLEDAATGEVHGTCQIFSKIGSTWPFYSYRLGVLTQVSKELDRMIRSEMLTLCTDLDGSTEVGGLFLRPEDRQSGMGKLLARSRYLFIKMHRARFADRTIAELRGVIDEGGASPFWDGVTGRFFGMDFCEADEFNAIHGNQFIADLMPKHPIYTALIPETALDVIGVPHNSGRAAMRMLEREGFVFENYIDIFDGGPTMTIPTGNIATIRDARAAPVTGIAADGAGVPAIIAQGRLSDFRACFGEVSMVEGGVALNNEAMALLGVSSGDAITFVPR